MKRPVTVGPWRMVADPIATRAANDRRRDRPCDCAYCRNFDAARALVYPRAFLVLLEEFGLPPSKEIEVYDMGRVKSGQRLYGGWFYAVGTLETHAPQELYELSPGFHVAVRPSVLYSVDGFEGLPVVALEFTCEVPWVLREPEPA